MNGKLTPIVTGTFISLLTPDQAYDLIYDSMIQEGSSPEDAYDVADLARTLVAMGAAVLDTKEEDN